MSNLLSQVRPLANAATDFIFSPGGHSAELTGIVDIVITVIGSIVVLGVIVATVVYLLRPREEDENHIKRRILNDGPGSEARES